MQPQPQPQPGQDANMQSFTITIDVEGNARQLQGHNVPDIIGAICIPVVHRASHVEPVNPLARLAFYACRVMGDDTALAAYTRQWSCLWRINLGPVNGPILPVYYRDRAEAIEAEIAWLNSYFM